MAKLLMTWKIFLFVLLTAIMGCEAQTFQYSRGWTNGKRSSSAGGSAYPPSALNQGQLYDMDNGILGVGLPIDDPTASVSIPAAVHFLNRKLALGSNSNGNVINSRKPQPIWIGTIMGIDQNQELSTSGRPSNSNNNSNNPPDF